MKSVVLILALVLGAPARAATLVPVGAKPLPGETVELKTVDGWTLKASYSKAKEGMKTFVLLHGTGQRKEDWRRLYGPLTRAGYGALAVDLRAHGDSRVSPSGETLSYKKLRATKAVNDYADMSHDVEAAVGWLAGQGVPEDTIGMIGAEVGGSLAVKYAAVHPKVPMTIMLSPGLAWQEIPIVNAVRAFKGRATPLLMIHSEADKRSSKETPLLHVFAKGALGERNATLMVVPQERGTRLFRAQRALAGQVIAWISDPVPPLPPETSTATAPGGVAPDLEGAPLQDKTLIDDTGTAAPAVAPSDDDGE